MLIISFMAVVFPLIPQALLFRLGIINQISIFDYVKIGGAFLSFFLIKTVLQIIFGVFVKKKEAVNRYLFEKQTYFSYLIFISLFPLMFLLFCPQTVVLWVYLFVFVWIMLFVLAMLLIMSRFKELILEHPLYFILYLCAFEICPIISAFYIIK